MPFYVRFRFVFSVNGTLKSFSDPSSTSGGRFLLAYRPELVHCKGHFFFFPSVFHNNGVINQKKKKTDFRCFRFCFYCCNSIENNRGMLKRTPNTYVSTLRACYNLQNTLTDFELFTALVLCIIYF